MKKLEFRRDSERDDGYGFGETERGFGARELGDGLLFALFTFVLTSSHTSSAVHFTTHHIRKPKETRNSNLLSSTSLPLREFQLRSPPALQFRHLKSVAFRVHPCVQTRACEYLEFFSLKRRNKVDYVESVTGSQGVSFPALSHMAINIPFVGYMAPIYLLSSLCMACFWKAFWTYVDHDTFTVVLDLAFGWLV
ncbi:hypothetical protein I3843_15G104000 [Carya illinoinensis]|nr:hypothetical protein I3843_15G104000 [Carya illinoinensis]